MSPTPPEAELAALNREIEQLEGEVAVLEEQGGKRRKAANGAAWRLRYLRAARWLRSYDKLWPQFRLSVLVVAPLVVGVVALILTDAITGYFSMALIASLVSACGLAAILASLFFRPIDNILPVALNEAESHSIVATAHWKEAFERLADIKERLQGLVEERRTKMASGRVQKAALLQRAWKTMSAAEWEDFVVEVCRTLGATAERRGRLDDGAELVVDFGSRRVAAIVRTAKEPIDSEAVRQAIAMRDREKCDACAIITNGRFTGAVQDYGPRQGCKLVGREEFPDFVLGQTEL